MTTMSTKLQTRKLDYFRMIVIARTSNVKGLVNLTSTIMFIARNYWTHFINCKFIR